MFKFRGHFDAHSTFSECYQHPWSKNIRGFTNHEGVSRSTYTIFFQFHIWMMVSSLPQRKHPENLCINRQIAKVHHKGKGVPHSKVVGLLLSNTLGVHPAQDQQ